MKKIKLVVSQDGNGFARIIGDDGEELATVYGAQSRKKVETICKMLSAYDSVAEIKMTDDLAKEVELIIAQAKYCEAAYNYDKVTQQTAGASFQPYILETTPQ